MNVRRAVSQIVEELEETPPEKEIDIQDVPDSVWRDAQRRKMYFPYRITTIAYKDGNWEVQANKTMAVANNLMRKGYKVWKI